MTRQQYELFCQNLHHLALDIGLRPACRALGISEVRGRKISSRRKWNLSKYSPALSGYGDPQESPKVTQAIEVKRALIEHHSDRTKLGFARTVTKVAEHLAEQTPEALVKPGVAIAAEQYGKLSDKTYGWSAARAQAPSVQIANIVLPSAEERAKIDAIDAKLDAFVGKYLKK